VFGVFRYRTTCTIKDWRFPIKLPSNGAVICERPAGVRLGARLGAAAGLGAAFETLWNETMLDSSGTLRPRAAAAFSMRPLAILFVILHTLHTGVKAFLYLCRFVFLRSPCIFHSW
jgi:hypothetical protein